jgi:hypothetical protein
MRILLDIWRTLGRAGDWKCWCWRILSISWLLSVLLIRWLLAIWGLAIDVWLRRIRCGTSHRPAPRHFPLAILSTKWLGRRTILKVDGCSVGVDELSGESRRDWRCGNNFLKSEVRAQIWYAHEPVRCVAQRLRRTPTAVAWASNRQPE